MVRCTNKKMDNGLKYSFAGDERIDFPEFLNLMTDKLETKDKETEIYEVFKLFDKDGDGFITASEMREVFMEFDDTLTEGEVDELVAGADEDGNGRLDFLGKKVIFSVNFIFNDFSFDRVQSFAAKS